MVRCTREREGKNRSANCFIDVIFAGARISLDGVSISPGLKGFSLKKNNNKHKYEYCMCVRSTYHCVGYSEKSEYTASEINVLCRAG